MLPVLYTFFIYFFLLYNTAVTWYQNPHFSSFGSPRLHLLSQVSYTCLWRQKKNSQ